jgi:predicted Fe-Mo cluster-binding NifX family protein
MRIAIVTDDGETIQQHFGRATHYLVLTIEDGQVIERELRPKLGHAQLAAEHSIEETSDQPHGFGAGARHRHGRMMESIRDCRILIAGGMGQGARASLTELGVQPILTELRSIEQAVSSLLAGTLADRPDRLH